VRFARHTGLAFWIIGLLLIGYGLIEAEGGRIYQAWRGPELDRTLRSPPARHTIAAYRPGSAIGRLEIPRLGLSVVVLEGSDTESLRLGIGRLPTSGMPGEPGNVVLAGHRDTFFRPLRQIRPGDRMSLETPEGTFAYTVDWTEVVDSGDTRVLLPTATPSLTLVTCYPFDYLGSAPRRFIVRAR
jgi:sortase A